MYYNDYEDYMRGVLGYNNTNDNTYGYDCCHSYYNRDAEYNRNTSNSNIEQMYPEIYKIINPMVCRMCDNNTQPVSEYMIEQMTDDIYDNVVNRVEIQNVINLNIGTTRDEDMEVVLNREEGNSRSNNTNNIQQNRSSVSPLNSGSNSSTSNKTVNKNSSNEITSKNAEQEIRETRSPRPRRRNTLLRDLIRILIINRLIRPGRPQRPPFRPGPGGPIGPRPGFPGMPPRPPMPRTDGGYVPNDYYQYM